jgi:putative aldouronate transport system substrate-binding protein
MKRLWTIAIVLAVLATAVFAAGDQEPQPVGQEEEEEVELYIKLPSNPPEDLDSVVTALEELTKEDLNATLRVEHYTWSDWKNKYKLDLVSGEPIDVLYSAAWAGFFEYQADGAFKDISQMLPDNAPRAWENIDRDRWLILTKENGEIYGVPPHWQQVDSVGFVYREDIRKVAEVPRIDSVDDLTTYLEAVKRVSDMKPMGNGKLSSAPWMPMVPGHNYLLDSSILYNVENPTAPLTTTADHRDAIIEWATVNRDWYDRGFYTHDVLANAGSARIAETDFRNGTVGMAFTNTGGFRSIKTEVEAEHPDWEVGFVPAPQLGAGGYSYYKGVTQDLTVFPLAGKNTERGLRFLDHALFDRDYYYLINYGVAGKHYDRVDESTISLNVNTGFGPQGMAFWSIRNNDLDPEYAGAASNVDQVVRAALAEKSFHDHRRDFYIDDTSPVKTILASISVVWDEHFTPLNHGIYPKDEIPGRVDAFISALKEAGVEELRDFIQPHWDVYIR